MKELILLSCKACLSTKYIIQQRASLILRAVLEIYGMEKIISDSKLKQEIEEACLTLLRGKPSLKDTAIKLAPLFENEGSRHCRWTWELLRIIAVSKTVEHRRAALESISLSKFSLPYILKKIHDVKEQVRCAVFEKLTKHKVDLAELKWKEKIDVLYSGLTDNKDCVREACEKYLKTWMNNIQLIQPEEPFCEGKIELDEVSRRMTRYGPRTALGDKDSFGPSCEIEKGIYLLKLIDIFNLKNDEENCIIVNNIGKLFINIFKPEDLLLYFKNYVKPQLLGVIARNNSEFRGSLEFQLKRKTVASPPQFVPEIVVFLRIICESWGMNKEHYREALSELEDILPDIEQMRTIIRHFIEKQEIYVTEELLIILPYYNFSEPKINQQLVLILDDLFGDVELDDSFMSEKLTQINQEYMEFIGDQLDLHRRDVIVRNMGDLIAVGIILLIVG